MRIANQLFVVKGLHNANLLVHLGRKVLVNEQTRPSASIPLQGQTMLYILELFSDKFFGCF